MAHDCFDVNILTKLDIKGRQCHDLAYAWKQATDLIGTSS